MTKKIGRLWDCPHLDLFCLSDFGEVIKATLSEEPQVKDRNYTYEYTPTAWRTSYPIWLGSPSSFTKIIKYCLCGGVFIIYWCQK